MLSKAISLLLVASTYAIAGQLPEGIYRIISVEPNSSARVYPAGSQIYVSNSRDEPGPYGMVSPSIFLQICYNYLLETTVGY